MRRLGLPMVTPSETPATVVEMRKRLGGPYAGGRDESISVGDAAISKTDEDRGRIGIVVDLDRGAAYVWWSAKVVRRHPVESIRRCEIPPSDAEASARQSAVRYGRALDLGASVTLRDGARGVLAEQCRFGYLVGLGDGMTVALGLLRIGEGLGDGSRTG